jgi:hypothetical protein
MDHHQFGRERHGEWMHRDVGSELIGEQLKAVGLDDMEAGAGTHRLTSSHPAEIAKQEAECTFQR